MHPNSIHWDRVNKLVEREGATTYWKPYGFPPSCPQAKA